MITRIIEFSIRNRLLVILLTLVLIGLGAWATHNIRLDAIPDLSDVQVIVVTDFPGQDPQTVDKQVTYPLTTALLSVPGATAVRGQSMFELSFVYVIFDDSTDLYWARSRVLEYLNFARDRLPAGVQPRLGPDATGVGWVYQYVLYPGYWSPDHPRGVWLDEATGKWYASEEEARRGAGNSDCPATHEGTEARRIRKVKGWEKAGVDPITGTPLKASGQDLASLRSLQDWYLRYPLAGVSGVAEVAPIGGFVRQYQIVVDPQKLAAYGVPIKDIIEAVRRSNNDVGGSVVELAENELMVRSRGYLRGLDDLGQVVVKLGPGNTPLLLRDIATLQIGGEMRRGVGELDGQGEAVGGVIISRFGENAFKVIADAKAKLAELEDGLPPGVFIKPTYDRSALIDRAVNTLRRAVIEELIVTALIILIFLAHVRSTLVAVFVLPVGLLTSILVMRLLGINANIMSLGGLALAISVMVDSANVMIENAHKHLERAKEEISHKEHKDHKKENTRNSLCYLRQMILRVFASSRLRVDSGGQREKILDRATRIRVITQAATEVGPSIFFSLLVITVAFLPIFVLGEQSGRLFKPLAYTKTFAIAAGAILGITIVPVLMIYFIRGRIPREENNPINRWSIRLYDPAFRLVMRHPILTLLAVLLLGASALYPLQKLGSEFMPQLEEGDLLYMPTTDPSVSVLKSKELLQQTDKIIAQFPEVQSVHGKIGRAETATDPAPLSMIETVVQLHADRTKWRMRTVEQFHGDWPHWLAWPFEKTLWPTRRTISMQELKYGWTDAGGTRHQGLNDAVSFPGIANAWPYPIENRINMLSTGIKTPVGIKITGPDLERLSQLAEQVAAAVTAVPGTLSAYPDRAVGGYYLDFDIDRAAAARYGLNVGDVQEVIQSAIGGMNITTTVEGPARYPVNLRYARELRDDPQSLERVLVPTPTGAQIPLGQLLTEKDGQRIQINPGPPMIRSENGQLSAWVLVDVTDARDLGGYVTDARRAVTQHVNLPEGYSLAWSGRFEYLQQANQRLMVVIPITVALIVLLLYIANGSWFRVGVILLAVPFSLIGAFWFMYALGYNLSLATAVGIIALLGVDAETGQVMLLYLDTTYDRFQREGRLRDKRDLFEAIYEGAVKRIRPKTMTVATDMIGLLPLLWATGTGADVTRRLVAPLIGGITVSFVMELLVYPVVFYLYKMWQMQRARQDSNLRPMD